MLHAVGVLRGSSLQLGLQLLGVLSVGAWTFVTISLTFLIIKALVMVLGLAGVANMWMAVFADTGVAMICVLNSIRILYKKF